MNIRVTSPRELVLANFGLLLMIFSWGAFFPILELLLTKWDFYSATLARQVCGATVLVVCVVASRKREPLPAIIPWRRILMLGGIGVGIGSLMTSIGVLLSNGLSSAVISTTNPIGAALTAAIFYKEPLGRGLLLATVLSVIGGFISVAGDRSLGDVRFQGGEVLIVLANVLWTWMSMAAQRWLRGFSQLQIATLTVGAGALWLSTLLPLVAASGLVQLRVDLGWQPLLLVAFAGIVPIAIGNFCWHYGVSRIGIVIASMYNNLLPAAALATTVLLGGSFTWYQLVGSVIIVTGVLSIQVLALRRNRTHRPGF
jgi:drug/metabolite transporter (DMT)-like permease